MSKIKINITLETEDKEIETHSFEQVEDIFVDVFSRCFYLASDDSQFWCVMEKAIEKSMDKLLKQNWVRKEDIENMMKESLESKKLRIIYESE